MFLYIFTILLAVIIHPSLGQGCPYKECACLETVIDCSNRGLITVPVRQNTGATYTTLHLNGNKITTIATANLLPIRLDTLDLRDNPISSITNDGLFGVSQSLKTLKIKNSNFATLPPVLEILDNLENLDIENNALAFPDATVSKLARSVLSLRLVNVGLVGWPAWLGKFVFLRQLYLDSNTRLSNPPVGSFDIWRQALTHLSISNIGATTLNSVSVLEKLQWLNASSNRLSDAAGISYDLIPLGNTLRFIDLSNNALTTEPRLSDLRVLTEANLGNNRISSINVGAFSPSIVTINLDRNQLTSIPRFLNDLPLVQNFSIRFNSISGVGAHDFPLNSRLTALYLGGNPITYVDEHGFDNFKTSLTYLDFENTKLTRLPLALKTLTKLQTLWIPNNQALVCTCDEKSLAPWITSLPTLRVVGQCGLVDVKEFIGQLAILCP